MQRTYISDARDGQLTRIKGFVENLRDGKSMAFLVIKDITGSMQVTVEKEKVPAVAEVVSQLTLDSVVSITGQVVANEYVKLNGIEMLPEEIVIESLADMTDAVLADHVVIFSALVDEDDNVTTIIITAVEEANA